MSILPQELNERQERLRILIKQLPECHLATAKLLFGHLVKVAANAEVNKVFIVDIKLFILRLLNYLNYLTGRCLDLLSFLVFSCDSTLD